MLVASLLNLDAAVAAAARAADGADVAVLCAGVEGAFAIDDAYVAGRIAAALGGAPDDAALAAMRLAGAFESAEDGIGAGISADNIRRSGLERGHFVVRARERPRPRAADRRPGGQVGRDRRLSGRPPGSAEPHDKPA